MRDDQKTKAELLQELNTLRERVSGHKRAAEEWSKIFDATSDIVFVQDKDFKVIKVNKSACDVLKVKPEDLIGKKCYEVLHKSDKPWPNCPLAKALKDKRPHTEEVYDPNIGIPLLISTSPLFDENGELTGVVHIAKDITERKRAEEKLKQYWFMVESAYDAIFFKDLKSRYVIANNKALEAFGLPREQVIGKNDYEIMPNREESKKNIEDDDLVFKTGKLTEVTKRMTGADGKERWFQAIKVPQFDDEGKIIGLVGIGRDITEHKRAEETLRRSEEKYRLLFEGMGTDNTVISVDGVYLMMNGKSAELLGGKPEQFIGKSVYDTFPKEAADKYVGRFRHVAESGQTKIYEDLVELPMGNRWFLTKMWPIKDPDGNITSVQLISYDITVRKRVEETLRESESKYRTLLENLPQKIFLKDRNSVYVSCNENYARDLNIKAEEIVGKTDYEFYSKELAEKYRKDDKRIMESGEKEDIEEQYIQDGKELIVHTVKTPVKDARGNVIGILGIFWDITELKRAEEQIRKLSFAVEQSIDGIAIGDLEPKLVYVNDAFARMHGYTPEEMIGMTATKLHNKSQMPEHKRHIKQLKIQGFWEGEISRIRKDGTAFLTYTSVTLLKNGEGKPTGTLVVVRDITESKRREEELNTYRENMVQAEELASVGTLSATFAHELTQPLTVIRLSIQNSLAELETTSCPGTVVEDLKEGLSEISDMTSMLNRFRNFARMSTKRTVSEVDFKAVAQRIVKLLDEGAWRAKVTLQVEGMDKLPLIYSYERDLEQLFFSLVENAIQAADGKKNRQLIISGTVRDEHIELRFSDNCGGIAPKSLDRIFEPFFTTKHADDRTGLGLCVVERIVSQLGGKVRVESKLGKGSTFFVTLPINRGGR